MSLSRIDCFFFRGGDESSREFSSYVAVNPQQRPGSFVVAGAAAVKQSIGSQVACKLALQHFVEGVLQVFESEAQGSVTPVSASDQPDPSLRVLEAAFRNANTSVYNFGHKLAAGGRLAASLVGLVIEEHAIAAGRVGQGSAYLCRSGEVFPFFEDVQSVPRDGYIGTQTMVSVELASVQVEEHDMIFLSSLPLTRVGERELASVVDDLELHDVALFRSRNANSARNPCAQIVQALFPDPKEVAFGMVALVGPRTIYLQKPLSVGL